MLLIEHNLFKNIKIIIIEIQVYHFYYNGNSILIKNQGDFYNPIHEVFYILHVLDRW